MDEVYLHRCQELAAIAASQGESPVGAVVVLAGEIIGEGTEASKAAGDITFHAEVEAIRVASKIFGPDLSAATLYSTHEPCILCSYVIRHHRLQRVVVKKAVAHIGGASSAYPILLAADIPNWGKPPIVEFWPLE